MKFFGGPPNLGEFDCVGIPGSNMPCGLTVRVAVRGSSRHRAKRRHPEPAPGLGVRVELPDGGVSTVTRPSSRSAVGRHGRACVHRAMKPPSTTIGCPVMNEAASEARNATTAPISRGSPHRSMGTRRCSLISRLLLL